MTKKSEEKKAIAEQLLAQAKADEDNQLIVNSIMTDPDVDLYIKVSRGKQLYEAAIDIQTDLDAEENETEESTE